MDIWTLQILQIQGHKIHCKHDPVNYVLSKGANVHSEICTATKQ